MDIVANPELLTPNIGFQTDIRLQAVDGSTPSNAEIINISVCSEFKIHSLPATAFDARHKLGIVLDTDHQPVVFTIGSDARFYCIQHVTGRKSWTATDITPGDAKSVAATFDVFQHSSGKVAVAVAVKTTASSSVPNVYHVKPFDVPGGFNPSGMAFVNINNDKSVSIVSIMIAASDAGLTKPCFIVVGTQETTSDRATDYVISTDPDQKSPWTTISIPENAKKVFKVTPVTQRKPLNACIASLYQQVVSGSAPPADVGTKISCLSLDGSYNIDVVLDKIGGGRDVSTTVTSKGLSDLYVAGVKGIGYYSSQKMDKDPIVILPDDSFRQIVASENKHKICVFALSMSGDLYYIEGERKTDAGTPTFTASPYPIRKDIGIISTQYNAAVNASETLYVNSANQLKHIWRDSQTHTWSEQAIHVPTTNSVISYPAFVAQIYLQGSRGAVIGGGREILLSATELTYVLINDTTHRLDKHPIKVTTDQRGYVRVVIQAGPQLGSPTITGKIMGVSGSNYSFQVQPRQRVLRKWVRIQSGSDLKMAKSTAGDPAFANTTIGDETFNTAAEFLKQTPALIAHFDKAASVDVKSAGTVTPNLMFACHKTSSGHRSSSNSDWTKSAKDGLCALGDFLESVWNGALNVAKFAVNIAGDVVNFFAEIRGKAMRWVLDTIGSVIRCVSTFLKETLGIDLTRFLALFGFVWDYPNILKTQQIIVKTVQDGAPILQDIVTTNASWMKDHIKALRSLVPPFINSERVPQGPDFLAVAEHALQESFLGKLLKSVLNNPIINDIMRYISVGMLEVMSTLDDQISFPGLGDLEKVLTKNFTAILEKFLGDAKKDIHSFIQDVVNGIGEVLASKCNIGDLISMVLSDVFWSIFDTAQDFALSLVDLLSDLMGAILKMIMGRIKLPGTSLFWESFMKTPFSIVDVGSMALAHIIYLVTMMWKEKLPFDVMTPWYLLLPKKGSIHFPPLGNNTGKETAQSESGIVLSRFTMFGQAPAEGGTEGTKSNDGAALTSLMVDLICNWVSSFTALLESGLELPMLSAKGRIEGFELQEWDKIKGTTTSTFPNIKAKRTALPFIANMQLACSGIGLFTKVIILCKNCGTVTGAATVREAFVPLLNLVALIMNGITLSVRINHSEETNPLALFLTPAGNIIGNLPSGIWGFVDSPKGEGDWLMLVTSILNTLGAGCDLVTTAASLVGDEEFKWIPFGISAGLNVGQAGTSVWYYCDYKANH